MLKITQVDYVKDYQVFVVFNDGQHRLFDFWPVIAKYPVFKGLEDLSKFRNYVLTDTLEWDNGEIDIAPEYLYENGVDANRNLNRMFTENCSFHRRKYIEKSTFKTEKNATGMQIVWTLFLCVRHISYF